MMEFYEAYATTAADGLHRRPAAPRRARGAGHRDLRIPGPHARFLQALRPPDHRRAIHKHHPGYTMPSSTTSRLAQAEAQGLRREGEAGPASAACNCSCSKTTEAELWEPTYIIDYPAEVSPLARASDSNPEITERFELFIVGREIANGFSELNDPEDQAARFQAAGQGQGGRRRRGHVLRRRLHPRARIRPAAHRRLRHRHRPPGDAAHRQPEIRDVILFPQMRRLSSPRHIAVIGAGIAGAATAHALARRGHQVTVLDAAGGAASGASGNLAGVFRPLPALDDGRLARVLRAGFLLGRRSFPLLAGPRLGWTGVLHVARDSRHEQTQQRIVGQHSLPADYCRFVTRDEASALGGLAGRPRWLVVSAGGLDQSAQPLSQPAGRHRMPLQLSRKPVAEAGRCLANLQRWNRGSRPIRR
jgi:hypothetical protein